MKCDVIGMIAETALHPGAESTGGAIDLPVSREKNTGYPFIPGSSIKGAFRDRGREMWEESELKDIFGHPDGSGGVSFTDARLLLLPVRSLSGPYKWVTCPYLIQRLARDLKMAGHAPAGLPPLGAGRGEALVYTEENQVFLEELLFQAKKQESLPQGLVSLVGPLVYHPEQRERLAGQLVIINDDEFNHFARFGLQVRARNVLDSETKESKNLWYEETISPDTLLYTLVMARPGKEKQLEAIKENFSRPPYLQVGGNETVGQGWCALSWYQGGETNELPG